MRCLTSGNNPNGFVGRIIGKIVANRIGSTESRKYNETISYSTLENISDYIEI